MRRSSGECGRDGRGAGPSSRPHPAVAHAGVDVIYDTVGTAETLEIGVRVANSRAPIVITGVGAPARFEWTPLYFKEVELLGSNAFGVEEVRGARLHPWNTICGCWQRASSTRLRWLRTTFALSSTARPF